MRVRQLAIARGVPARSRSLPLVLQIRLHRSDLGIRIRGGQHVKYPQDSRFADLLVTLFDRNNIPVEKIGDSGGILSEV